MENDVKVFDQVETATGRKLGVVVDEQHGLFKVRYIDGKGGALPTRLQGRYTGVKFAMHDLTAFAAETFAIAAEHSPKQKKAKVEDQVAA